MGNLTAFQKWKYAFWTLGVFVLIMNPLTWRALYALTDNPWLNFTIQSILFLLAERALMEFDS